MKPADCASALRRFADGTSMADSELARILRATLRAFSSAHSPRPRGPEDQEGAAAAFLLTSSPCDAAEGGR